MVTLTKFAFFFKKASVLGVLGLAIILLLLIILVFGKNIKNSFIAPKAPAASVAYGKLPRIDLSEGIKPQGRITYKLETISGDLPLMPTSAKVFKVESSEPSFGSLADIKAKAGSFGFGQEPQIIGGVFKFVDPKDGARTLTVDSSGGNFFLQSNLEGVLRPASTTDAVRKALDFLNNFNLNNGEFDESKAQTENLKIENGNLSAARSFAEADTVRVNFFRRDLDKLPIVPITSGTSRVWVLVSGTSVVGAKIDLYNLARFKFATYPLKGVQDAYQELQNGQAVFNKNPDTDTLEITSVTLGYIESSKTSDFLEPFYIFNTNGSLKAFVGAVSDDWIRE